MRARATWGGPWLARVGGLAVLCLVGLLVVGAVRNATASAIVKAPNHDRSPVAMLPPPADVSRAVRVEVGPPVAELEAWILDPERSPRGTTLVLHGAGTDKRAMIGVGRSLRARGLRAILVDLRGHGGSSGRYLTYGVRESQDLRQLLDALEPLGLVEGPVSVYGASYGGAVGIHLSAIDPRIVAVASTSTFASLREVVPPYARRRFDPLGSLLPEAMIELFVDDAGHLGGFSPDAADTCEAIARTRARVLLVHGRADRRVPFAHAEALLEACPHGRCTLLPVEGADAAPGALGGSTTQRAAADFLERWGTRGAAPPAPRP